MKKGLLKAGVTCVESCNQDILSVNPEDPKYSKVEYIIVDPSCSGSGIYIQSHFRKFEKSSSSTDDNEVEDTNQK